MPLLVGGVGAAGVLQLVQQVLVLVVAGLHVHRGAGLALGADVVAQPGVGQRGIVVPAGVAVPLGNAVQHVQRLLVVAVADVVVGGLHLRRVVAGALAAEPAAVKPAEPKAERVKPKAEGVLILLAAVAAGTAVAALAAVPALAAGGRPGVAVAAALALAHDLAVSGLHFLELVLGGGVVGVQVGVELLALLAICFFDGLLVGALADAQDAVWITHAVSPPLCACPRAVL